MRMGGMRKEKGLLRHRKGWNFSFVRKREEGSGLGFGGIRDSWVRPQHDIKPVLQLIRT